MRQKCWNDLAAVTTVTEAAQLYGVTRRTVQRWCDEGHVIATRSAGIWIISMRSLIAFRGFPPHVPNPSDFSKLA